MASYIQRILNSRNIVSILVVTGLTPFLLPHADISHTGFRTVIVLKYMVKIESSKEISRCK